MGIKRIFKKDVHPKGGKPHSGRPIMRYKLDDGNMVDVSNYDSIADASRKTKISDGSIDSCLRRITKTAGGYHWIYIDEKDGD